MGHVVEMSPQLLILPVLLVVRLLDNMLSSALPLSVPLMPILATGVISCVCVALVVVYISFPLVHGGLYLTDSPLQTTFSQLIESFGPRRTTFKGQDLTRRDGQHNARLP